MKEFSQLAMEKLGECYVYALVDPRSDQVFYIGKGSRARVFAHEKEAYFDYNPEKEKHKQIQEIENSGLAVKEIIVNFDLSVEEAFAAEASLINLIKYQNPQQLKNIVSGHHSVPAMTVQDFEEFYCAAPISKSDIHHNVLVIKVNKVYKKGMSAEELKEMVRGHWRISTRNASKAEYIFAVFNGLIVGIYESIHWYPSNVLTDFYPRADEYDEKRLKRYYCTCDIVSPDSDVWKAYYHKSIKEFASTTQNPISYILNGDV